MRFVKKLYFKQIALLVAFSIFVIGSIPSKSLAYMVTSDEAVAATQRAADMETVQRVLESKLVAEKLSLAGLSKEEIDSRLASLNDQELHSFASQLDALYPGGDGLGVVIALLIIIILVMVILKLADRKIVIK